MLVKKIGHTILVKTKAYKFIKFIASLLIIATFALFLIVPIVTENYQFQQPALKTKVSILEPSTPNDIPIQYSQIYQGVRLALIGGRLTGQTILLVANCGVPNKTTNQVFENVYQSITKVNKKQRRLLAKNVGFLCYNSSQSLHSFMRMQSGLSEPKPHKQGLEMGIIRNALFVELNQQIRKDRKQARIYFNQYSQQSQLHVDLDYYQAIKQLLQQSGVTKWQPCSYLHTSKFLANVLKIGNNYINFGGRHLLCQFYQVFRRGKIRDNFIFKSAVKVNNKNYMLMQNGVQAATIQAWFPAQNKTDVVNKLSKVALGFLQEFVVLEDHLHSSSTLFVPVSQSKYIPLKGLIIPGLGFLIASAAHLILKAIYLMNQSQRIEQSKTEQIFLANSLQIKLNKTHPIFIILMLIAYLGSFEFYINSTGYCTIFIATILRFMIKASLTPRQKQLVRIFLAALAIFMCQYAAIFCFPLSVLLMVEGVLLIFTNRHTTLFVLALGLSAFVYLSQLNLLAVGLQIMNLSPMAQFCLYPILIWGFIV